MESGIYFRDPTKPKKLKVAQNKYLIVSLLEGDSQWREAVLGRQALIGSRSEKESNNSVMVFLSGHVQGSESILRLDIDGRTMLHQDLDHGHLSGQGGNMEGGIAFLGRRIDLGTPGQELGDDSHMALFGGQVEGIQSVLQKA